MDFKVNDYCFSVTQESHAPCVKVRVSGRCAAVREGRPATSTSSNVCKGDTEQQEVTEKFISYKKCKMWQETLQLLLWLKTRLHCKMWRSSFFLFPFFPLNFVLNRLIVLSAWAYPPSYSCHRETRTCRSPGHLARSFERFLFSCYRIQNVHVLISGCC